MDWQAVIKDYEGFLKLEKGLSPNSIEAYLGDIAKLKHFLESEDMNLGPEELDREKLGQFLVWISESGLSARSQARILSGIKVFYRYLMMEEMIEKDPTALLEGPRLGTKLPEVLTVNEIDRMLECIDLSKPQGRRNKAIIRDPDQIPTPDFLVMESTYGDRLHEDIHDAMDRLAEVVGSTVRKGGKVLIPAFAIERTQEIIYYLHLLVEQGTIPRVPIFVDSPMATNATSIFRVHPECYDRETQEAFIQHHQNPFGFNELKYTSSVQESKAINDVKGPAIIISADGMCEAGRIRHHLVQNVRDPRNTILIVGYMASHTLGRRIMERQKQVRIFGELFDLKARVEKINAFSAHADYSEISDYVGALDLDKLKAVFLVHGEGSARENLKKVLQERGIRRVETVEPGTEYPL